MDPPGGQGVDQVIHNGPHIEITIPWDIEHRFRSPIKHAAEAVICTLEFGTTTDLMSAFASPLVILGIKVASLLVVRGLRQYQKTLDSKDLLNRVGIDHNDTISGQPIDSSYQLDAMQVLFPNVPWKSGPEDMLALDQLNKLTAIESGVPILLNNSHSIAVFTGALSKVSSTDNIEITIDSAYFQGRDRGSQGRSNIDMMDKLGLALRDRKGLKHLTIDVTPGNGHGTPDDAIFAGLRVVLGCKSLETLYISGMPSFLQDENIEIKCRHLKEFDLVGVNVDTYQAFQNINKVLRYAKGVAVKSRFYSVSPDTS
ncbi:hypothetical protein BGX34_002275 [Mortierella sp. NVP85]|nr:hypothetical protein BGX34_002275 [Mortierella sp. NVP85]